MAFAQNLEKCFHILTQGQTYTEEELCIKLEDALLLCNKFSLVNREIVILHNPDKKEVEFQLKRDWNTDYPAGTVMRCLLGDMLYVIYSPGQKKCRIFLMKNHLKRGTEFINRFYTEVARLDLLSSRSVFTLEGQENSCDFLSKAEVRSIADYGIFHKVKGYYDMQIFSADLSTPLQEFGVEPRRVFVFRGTMDQHRVSAPNWIEDYEGYGSLRSFGRAIEDMRIGQPVTQNWKDELLEHLRGMDEMEIPKDFCEMEIDFLQGAYEKESSFDFLQSIGSIVLINVDEE